MINHPVKKSLEKDTMKPKKCAKDCNCWKCQRDLSFQKKLIMKDAFVNTLTRSSDYTYSYREKKF